MLFKDKSVVVKRDPETLWESVTLGDEAILKFLPWSSPLLTGIHQKMPLEQDIISDVKDREYVKIKTAGGPRAQPRKTICYGESYQYSGQTHPVEKHTPDHIEMLYETTEKLCGKTKNMCLLNVYLHGNHSISEHSDDERQMQGETEVHCWVIGDQPRKAIFRCKIDKKKTFHVTIPSGLYIMSGSKFQRDFTHEFPKMYQTAYKKAFEPLVPNDVSKNKADWLLDHKEEIEKRLSQSQSKYLVDFKKWCQPRLSFTLRFFSNKNKKRKY